MLGRIDVVIKTISLIRDIHTENPSLELGVLLSLLNKFLIMKN
jgi:hypothetical protein